MWPPISAGPPESPGAVLASDSPRPVSGANHSESGTHRAAQSVIEVGQQHEPSSSRCDGCFEGVLSRFGHDPPQPKFEIPVPFEPCRPYRRRRRTSRLFHRTTHRVRMVFEFRTEPAQMNWPGSFVMLMSSRATPVPGGTVCRDGQCSPPTLWQERRRPARPVWSSRRWTPPQTKAVIAQVGRRHRDDSSAEALDSCSIISRLWPSA